MSKKFNKGYSRRVHKIICCHCGINCGVMHDELDGTDICMDCIEKEEDLQEDKDRSGDDYNQEVHNEEIYRRGVDDESSRD